MKKAWDKVKLTRRWWDGQEPKPGDGLITPSGRKYQILSVRGKVLECLVLPKDEPITGTLFNWEWSPRTRRFVSSTNNSHRRSTLTVAGVALATLALTGCALFKPAPVEYVPFEVKVPVAVPCAADPGPEPEWATKPLKKSDTLDDKTKALLAERAQRMGYEEKLKAATDGCR